MGNRKSSSKWGHTKKPESLFIHASQCAFSTLYLAKYTSDTLSAAPPGVPVSVPTNMPSIVLSALSLELYLKCLVAIERGGDYPYDHEIVNLFNLVSTPRQKRIKDLFDEEFNRNPIMVYMREQVANKNGSTLDKKDLTLKGLLEGANNAFIEWRYAFEGVTRMSGVSTQPVRDAVARTILEIKPEWEKMEIGFQSSPTSPTR
jgi:hypothetical protein